MFSVTLLAVGRLKEKFYAEAVKEYEKRLSAFCRFKIIELPEVRLPENPGRSEIDQGLAKEAVKIEEAVPKGAWFCVLTPEGKELSSEKLAAKLDEIKLEGKSEACFLIGSSYGMAPEIKQKADFRLSFGPMTFPHHLMRVMALEQIYRAQSIEAGTRYHK